MYLPFVLGLFLVFQIKEKKDIFKGISVLFVGFLVIVLPWMNRNYINSKVFSISSITDYNMAFYNIPEFIKYKFGKNEYDKYYSNILNLETKYDFRLLQNKEILKDLVSDNLKGNFISYTFFHLSYIPKFLISSPIRYISINTGNIYNDFIGINKSVTKITILNLDRLYMATVSLLAFMSLYFAFRNRKIKNDLPTVVLLFCLVGYFAVLTGPVAIPRYRLPVDGFVIILALYSIYSIMPTICRRLRLTR